ncbi:hypothetical protein GGE65_007162 [Skermanella aerolata]
MKLTSAASCRMGLTQATASRSRRQRSSPASTAATSRNWHDKWHNFEVVVGKCMATDRDDRYFGLVRSQDEQPGRRFRDVLCTKALAVTQTVTMFTDGGDSVRALADELSPGAVTILDWFHIAMRMTGLEQYAKGLAHHNLVEALALHSRLERIQWRLWHGDGEEALARAQSLAANVAALNSGYPGRNRLVKAIAGWPPTSPTMPRRSSTTANAGATASGSRPLSWNQRSTE